MPFSCRRPMLLLPILMGVAAVGAQAQAMRPGLWEVTTSPAGGMMGGAMAEMQRRMASMSTAQRRQAEAMMQKQGGRQGPDGTSSQRICITRDMLERNALPTHVNGRCTTSVLPRTGSTQTMRYVCTQPPASGEGVFNFASAETYTLRMHPAHGAQGTSDTSAMNASGRWVSAECTTLR